MPFTVGEVTASGLLSMALLAFGGWLKSIVNRFVEGDKNLDEKIDDLKAAKQDSQEKFDKRLEELEDTVSEKCGLLDVHQINLDTGRQKMSDMGTRLDSLDKGVADLHLQGQMILGNIKGLGKDFQSGVEKVWLKVAPKIERHEEKIKDLEDNNKK